MIKSLSFLFLAQIAGYIIPLVEIILFSRNLGAAAYGQILYAQSIVLMLSVFVEYGFGLSATREVAKMTASDKNKMAILVGKVTMTKLTLLILVFLILLAVIFTLHGVKKIDYAYIPWMLIGLFGFGLSPYWYYQGIEKLGFPVSIDLSCRLLALVGMLLVVSTPEDAIYVLVFQSIAVGLATSITHIIMLKRTGILYPTIRDILLVLKKGFTLFVFKGLTNIFSSIYTVIAAYLFPMTYVTNFNIAEKVGRAIQGMIIPIHLVLYPKLNREKTKRLGFLTTIAILFIVLIMVVTVYLNATQIVQIFAGSEFTMAVSILKIFVVVIFLKAISSTLVIIWLFPNNKDKLVSNTTLIGGSMGIVLTFILAPVYGIYALVYALGLTELGVLLIYLYQCRSCFPVVGAARSTG